MKNIIKKINLKILKIKSIFVYKFWRETTIQLLTAYALIPVHTIFLTFYCIMISGFCTNEMAYAELKYISTRLHECINARDVFSQNLPWLFACWVSIASLQCLATWNVIKRKITEDSQWSSFYFDVLCFFIRLCFFYMCFGICAVVNFNSENHARQHFTAVGFLIVGVFFVRLVSCIGLHVVLNDLKLNDRYFNVLVDYDEMDGIYLILCIGFVLFYVLNLRSWAVLTENILACYIFFMTILNWYLLVALVKEECVYSKINKVKDSRETLKITPNFVELILFTFCCLFPYMLIL